MTDSFFENSNMAQLRWYAEQIFIDEQEEFERTRDYIEYMASFWNPESVQKIKESREAAKSHKFASDKEFEKQILEKKYKNNKYVEAILKLQKERNGNNPRHNEEQTISNLPRDLKFLKDY